MMMNDHGEQKRTLQLKRDNIEKLQSLRHEKDVEEIQQINEKIEQETNLQIKTI